MEKGKKHQGIFQSIAKAWLGGTEEIFIQQAFHEYLHCVKHRTYCNDLERAGLYPLKGWTEGQLTSLTMSFGDLRGALLPCLHHAEAQMSFRFLLLNPRLPWGAT